MSASNFWQDRCWKIMKIKVTSGLKPGDPEYLRYAKRLMPLEVLLGYPKDDGPRVIWRPGQESNGFFLVLGASGSGKTETLKAICSRIAEQAIPVLVFDFHGDVICRGLNTVLLSSGIQSTIGINPLELDSFDADQVGLYEQRVILLEMLQRVVRLGHKQKTLLKEIIEEAYLEAGVLDDYPATWHRPPPTMADVLSMLHRRAVESDITAEDRNVVKGCISAVSSVFGHPVFLRRHYLTSDNLLRGNLRIDLSKINSEEVRHIVAETLLRKIFRVLRLRGKIPDHPADDSERFRLFIVIDEAKILGMVGGDVNDSLLILNILITEGRKYGIGLILASQMSEHFGHEIKANASAWLVLKPMDSREARRNAPNACITPDALTALNGHGDGYFRTGTMPTPQLIQVDRIYQPDPGPGPAEDDDISSI
jgi:hypothetical protein